MSNSISFMYIRVWGGIGTWVCAYRIIYFFFRAIDRYGSIINVHIKRIWYKCLWKKYISYMIVMRAKMGRQKYFAGKGSDFRYKYFIFFFFGGGGRELRKNFIFSFQVFFWLTSYCIQFYFWNRYIYVMGWIQGIKV